jgi:hypothetical protein
MSEAKSDETEPPAELAVTQSDLEVVAQLFDVLRGLSTSSAGGAAPPAQLEAARSEALQLQRFGASAKQALSEMKARTQGLFGSLPRLRLTSCRVRVVSLVVQTSRRLRCGRRRLCGRSTPCSTWR